MAPRLTLAELKKLDPCSEDFKRIKPIFNDVESLNAAEAVSKGATFNDLVWVVSSVALKDGDVERRLRLWMADCAARVLHIYEKTETSAAPRKAIIAARQYARGEIDDAAGDAARDAAGAAARDAARAAAWDAARAAALDAAKAAARDAAWAAARDAAWAAAWAAAWDAAWAAAWDAARAAALDAALAAAWDAARAAALDAARAAAKAAARDAAWAAEKQWQLDRLIAWLSDDEPDDWPLPELKQTQAA